VEALSTPGETVAGRNPAVFLMNVCAIVVSGLDWNVNEYLKGRPFKVSPAFNEGQKPNKDSPE
jgi:hypothetical protein